MQIPEASGPSRQAVDGGIKVIQSDIHPFYAAADDLPADLLGFVIKQHHMVAVPANGSGDMEGDLREESQQGGDFVADDFCGVIVAVVHQRDTFISIESGVAQGKLSGTHRVRFHADTEHFALDAGLDFGKIVGFGQDLVNGLPITLPRPHAVAGDVLETVACPDIHHAGLSQLLRQIAADADAGFPVLDPEPARLLVGGAEGQRVALGMGEEGGVEIAAQAELFAEVYPFPEVLRLQLVPVGPLPIFKNSVAGMKIQLFRARTQLQHHIQVCHQFLRSPGAARVVAGGLDAPGEGLGRIGVKAAHIVPLPTVEGNRDGFQTFEGGIGVHMVSGVFCFCVLIAHV